MTNSKGKNAEKGEGQAAAVAESALVVSEGSIDEVPRERSLNGRTTGPTRRSTKGQWTPEEDAILYKAVQRFKGRNWKKIAECFPDRTDVQCLHRWQKVLNPDLVKGPWSKEEDDIIIEMVNKHGPKKWSTIAQALPGRIGKQCRERWHNHLNPAINKEAWTQEEEIILIHAHQIYGNKWAELTKFLPGRTDNAIKNHWNSSVKKKLDSYMASGLLAQFKGLPQIDNSMQYISSSGVTQQNGEEDRRGVDSSDCSQSSSTLVGCSQTDCELINKVSVQKDLKTRKKSRKKMVQDPHLSTDSKGFYTSVDEVSCAAMSELQIVDASRADLLTEVDVSERVADEVGTRESSLEDSWKSIQTSECHTLCTIDHGKGTFWQQTSLECNVPNFVQSIYPVYENQAKILVPGVDCIHGEFPETEMCQGALQGLIGQTNFVALDYSSGEKWQPTYDSETYKAILSCSNPMYPVTSSDVPGISSCENLMSFIPSSYMCPNDAKPYKGEVNTREVPVQGQDSEVITCSYDGFAYSSIPYSRDSNSSPQISLPEDNGQDIETPKKSSMETEVASSPSISQKVTLLTGNDSAEDKIQEPVGLFYEPPCFPSLEIPFVSCDLVSSGDLQQAYSPLGIRQLMSSMNCSTPFNLWDSPSHEKSPDALLKSAAKSFLCTPSIMKKRHRSLLSPLQERRNDKKSGIDINYNRIDFSSESGTESCCTITENKVIEIGVSSCFSEKSLVSQYKQNSFDISIENKENSCDKSKFVDDENDCGRCDALSESSSNTQTPAKHESCVDTLDRKIKHDANVEKKMPSAVLAERDANDLLLYSPGGSGGPANRFIDTCTVFLKNGCPKNTIAASNGGLVDSCTICVSEVTNILSSTVGDGNKDEPSVVASKISATSTYPSECAIEKDDSSIHMDLGTFNILADTPSIKRGLESPSAWKSPWFMNSLLPIQKIGTDLTYEGVGYFVSPASGSYDAIDLMRQLSEHTAAAIAEAQEVLGSGSDFVESVEGNVQSDKESADSQIHSKVMVEARVLDFSGCTTPNKSTECAKLGKAGTLSLSSPSSASYLMKGFR